MRGRAAVRVPSIALPVLITGALAQAHEVRPGFFELRETAPGRYSFVWRQPAGGETPIYVVPILPAGCLLATAGQQRLTPGAPVVRGTLECPGSLQGRTLEIDGLAATSATIAQRTPNRYG